MATRKSSRNGLMAMVKTDNQKENKEIKCVSCEFYNKEEDMCERLGFARVLDFSIQECGDFLVKEDRIFF